VYFNSGKVSLLSGDTGDARKEFEQALRLVPDHPGAHYELARLDASAGRLDDAVRHYEDVLRAAPVAGIVRAELAAVLVTRGTSFAAAGRTDQARVDFTRALELDPASEAARQAAARLDEGTRGSGS